MGRLASRLDFLHIAHPVALTYPISAQHFPVAHECVPIARFARCTHSAAELVAHAECARMFHTHDAELPLAQILNHALSVGQPCEQHLVARLQVVGSNLMCMRIECGLDLCLLLIGCNE